MAFITGYVSLPVDSYDSFKNAVLGNGYDADGSYGDQCWDLTAELWHNVGFPTGYPHTGANHYASECWTASREANTSYNGVEYFDLIYNLSDIKKGDVIVWNGSTQYPAGHIALADEDYNGTGSIKVLGQNQGSSGTPTPIPNPQGGTTANVASVGTINFLGAFRYKEWHVTPPPTPDTKSNFKWVLYARKLNNRRNSRNMI